MESSVNMFIFWLSAAPPPPALLRAASTGRGRWSLLSPNTGPLPRPGLPNTPQGMRLLPYMGQESKPQAPGPLYSQSGRVHLQKVNDLSWGNNALALFPRWRITWPLSLISYWRVIQNSPCQLLRQYQKQIIIKTAMIHTAFSMGLFNLGCRWYYYPPFIAEETEAQRSWATSSRSHK